MYCWPRFSATKVITIGVTLSGRRQRSTHMRSKEPSCAHWPGRLMVCGSAAS